MPKRKNEEKIRKYRRKIQKLQAKEDKYKRILYSSEDSDESNDGIVEPDPQDLESVNQDDIGNQVENDIGNSGEPTPGPATEPAVPELDPDILSALGETTIEVPKFGPKIHDKLSCLWLPILKKGLNKDVKEKLVKEYLIPENCSLLQAPKLNPEISAAVVEGARTRDKRVETVQQQLGQGITALNKGLELLLDDGQNRIQAIKFLSDSCRILCDLHHVETESRKKFITPGLDKAFLNIIQDVDRDDLLFGNKLSEKIKATKAIEKQGLQIKKPPPIPKTSSTSTSTNHQASTSRSRQQGNWTGPPRFSSIRGGRGGQRSRGAPVGRRPQSAGPAQQKQPTQTKQPRATTQQ
ncbi:uncharacterized protein LOC123868715 [Maniola jurtina]|uniref:uncharacterized protein LOC123868715 n=1 Tax=Maniola jurtina TaxID=191418 RepID=UPI001E68C3F5|nr:uncharacterized protein LOC123868715 [Maniola jurtina]